MDGIPGTHIRLTAAGKNIIISEGKVTGDKAREVQGKAQQAKGKIKEKAKKLKDDLEDH